MRAWPAAASGLLACTLLVAALADGPEGSNATGSSNSGASDVVPLPASQTAAPAVASVIPAASGDPASTTPPVAGGSKASDVAQATESKDEESVNEASSKSDQEASPAVDCGAVQSALTKAETEVTRLNAENLAAAKKLNEMMVEKTNSAEALREATSVLNERQAEVTALQASSTILEDKVSELNRKQAAAAEALQKKTEDSSTYVQLGPGVCKVGGEWPIRCDNDQHNGENGETTTQQCKSRCSLIDSCKALSVTAGHCQLYFSVEQASPPSGYECYDGSLAPQSFEDDRWESFGHSDSGCLLKASAADLEPKVNEVRTLKQQVAEASTLADQSDERIRSLETKLTEVTASSNAQVAAVKSDLESRDADLQSVIAKLSERTADLRRRTAEFEGRTAELGKRTAELDENTKLLKALQQEHAELRERYEDPSMEDFLSHRAIKIYHTNPAIGGAVNKTFKYIVPRLTFGRAQGEMIINHTREKVTQQLKSYASENTIVMVSGLLIYGLGIIPLVVTCWLLTNIRAVVGLRPMLLFCHTYVFLMCLFATVGSAAFTLDPLMFLYLEYYGVYLFTQAVVATLFTAYVLMQLAALAWARFSVEKVVRLVMLGISSAFGWIYYRVVWAPAMVDKPPGSVFGGMGLSRPLEYALPYMTATLVFAAVLRMEQFLRASRDKADIAADKISISVQVKEESPKGPIELRGAKLA